MTNRRVISGVARRKETYVPDTTPYKENSGRDEYFVIPTRFPKQVRVNGDYRKWRSTKPVPEGWVDISGITGPVVRRLDDGYLRQRLSLSKSNISYNQAYINKVLSNPRTPQCNREAAISFVRDHPDLFLPRATDTGDPELDRYHSIINGDRPDRKFLRRFI